MKSIKQQNSLFKSPLSIFSEEAEISKLSFELNDACLKTDSREQLNFESLPIMPLKSYNLLKKNVTKIGDAFK